MGGVVGLLLAERHPQRVAALVDVDGNISIDDCTYSGRAAAMSLQAFVAGGFGRLREAILDEGPGDPATRGYYASLRLCDPATYHLHSSQLVEMSRREDLAARLAALDRPVIYIAGVPGGACDRSLDLLARAGVRTVTVGPAGHWPFIDQPARFADELARVLSTVAVAG
jgi:pimeloyl-ACP methyl ester carboxylesterase